MARQLELDDPAIRRALEKARARDFEETTLYERVFARAQSRSRTSTLPRAVVPRIALKSPKIKRKLTTEWFATRVDQRYRECLAKALHDLNRRCRRRRCGLDLAVQAPMLDLRRYHSAGAFRVGLRLGQALAPHERGLFLCAGATACCGKRRCMAGRLSRRIFATLVLHFGTPSAAEFLL